jgi:hypothetical protein
MPAVVTIPKTIQTWGCPKKFAHLNDSPSELQAKFDMWAFAHYFRGATGVPRRYTLFQRIADFLVPGWFEWHEWTERIIDALCRRRWVGITGCAGSAKTRNFAGYGCIYWICAPEETSFIMCSTTKPMLRKRGWAEIYNFYAAFTKNWGEFGNFVDSRTMWQYQAGDDKHAIFGIAVQDGNVDQAAANIQGIHTKRQLVGIDEAEAVHPAMWKASINLYSYPIDSGGEFTLGATANPRSRISAFGRFIEPVGGWDSVSVETDEWESKQQADGKKALIVRLDFLKSPNVKADKSVSKHLPTKARVEKRMEALKARGGENDADHYCYDRGFPPAEGMSKTVFTESLISKHDGYGRHTFTGESFTIISFFDQAFGGGDRPALRFGALGNIAHDKMGIEWMAPIEIFIDANAVAKGDPVRYQLMARIREHCDNVQYRGQRHTCLPENFGLDATGDGGLADIMQREWSPSIIRVMFSGSPSDEPCSHEDPRLAKEVYRNKRAEMHFRTRNALMAGQLKGIDRDTAAELCTIEYRDFNKQGIKIPLTIQDKSEYKSKFGKSPDYGDCGVGLTEVARLRGFRIVETGHTVTRSQEFDKTVEKASAVYVDIDYSGQEDDEPAFEMDSYERLRGQYAGWVPPDGDVPL